MSLCAASNAIISLNDIKSYLRIADTDDTQDDFLQFWINAISDGIERYIRGPAAAQAFSDEIHDGDGTRKLTPDRQPVISLQNDFPQDVMFRDDPAMEWQVLEDDPGCISIDPTEPWRIRLYREMFPAGRRNIKICYIAGYDPVPGPIVRVCIEAVAEIFKESAQGSGRLGQHSRSVGGLHASSAIDVFIDLGDRHRALLAPYVRMMP